MTVLELHQGWTCLCGLSQLTNPKASPAPGWCPKLLPLHLNRKPLSWAQAPCLPMHWWFKQTFDFSIQCLPVTIPSSNSCHPRGCDVSTPRTHGALPAQPRAQHRAGSSGRARGWHHHSPAQTHQTAASSSQLKKSLSLVSNLQARFENGFFWGCWVFCAALIKAQPCWPSSCQCHMQKFCALLELTPVHYTHHKESYRTGNEWQPSFVSVFSREATVIMDTEPFHSPVFASSVTNDSSP